MLAILIQVTTKVVQYTSAAATHLFEQGGPKCIFLQFVVDLLITLIIKQLYLSHYSQTYMKLNIFFVFSKFQTN